MIKKFVLIFTLFSATLSNSPASTISVDPDSTIGFNNITDAIAYIASLEANGYKHTSSSSELACFPSGGNSIIGVNTSWTNTAAIGDQISLNSQVWYEITEIISDTEITVNRNSDLTYGTCSSHEIAEVHTIELLPGHYAGEFNFSSVHFIRLRGIGPREAIRISNYDSTISITETTTSSFLAKAPIHNINIFGAVYFENLTINSLYGGSAITSSSQIPNAARPEDTDIYIKNVYIEATLCCDLMFEHFGHLQIENSHVTGGVDIIGGDVKSLIIRNSTITSQTLPTIEYLHPVLSGNSAKALHITIKYDSLIENSVINTYNPTKNVYVGSPGAGTGVLLTQSNGATLKIINSDITAIAGTGRAIRTSNSLIEIEDSRVNGKGGLDTADINAGIGSSVSVKCSGLITSTGIGELITIPCN